MIHKIKQLAIIGPTASGKSDLAIKIASKIDAYILSIDSLSIYKDIDIVSAKPSKDELAKVRHFGIDLLTPNKQFSAETFINLYEETQTQAQKDGKNLLIVGGTSFYLKALLEGLSELPAMDEQLKEQVAKEMLDQNAAYAKLAAIDPLYMQKIAHNDSYRTHKALLIYEASGQKPSEWFAAHPPKPIIDSLEIFDIFVERETLRKRITQRTKKMCEAGLIDEITQLEKRYTRAPNAMKSIGIVEVLEYLDGEIDFVQMQEQITLHTAQLAKRQQTFNKTQFTSTTQAPLEALEEIILKRLFS